MNNHELFPLRHVPMPFNSICFPPLFISIKFIYFPSHVFQNPTNYIFCNTILFIFRSFISLYLCSKIPENSLYLSLFISLKFIYFPLLMLKNPPKLLIFFVSVYFPYVHLFPFTYVQIFHTLYIFHLPVDSYVHLSPFRCLPIFYKLLILSVSLRAQK